MERRIGSQGVVAAVELGTPRGCGYSVGLSLSQAQASREKEMW